MSFKSIEQPSLNNFSFFGMNHGYPTSIRFNGIDKDLFELGNTSRATKHCHQVCEGVAFSSLEPKTLD